MAQTGLKVRVIGQGHEVRKRYFEAFAWEPLCITTMDYVVTLQCRVTSQNDVMTSSDVTKITSVARQSCKIYDAGSA